MFRAVPEFGNATVHSILIYNHLGGRYPSAWSQSKVRNEGQRSMWIHHNESSCKTQICQILLPPSSGRHGDMLFLSEQNSGVEVDGGGKEGKGQMAPPTPAVAEDEVDKVLAQKDGKIYRKKDPQL